jgi:glycosyltransferase involved in cell wall biosynthesis
VLIIIPAYNEEANVGAVVLGCRRWGRVVVIDDGSMDRTAGAAEAAGARVIRQGVNQGYSAAIWTGYCWAMREGYVHIVQLDADGQHDPRFIPRLINRVAGGECDIAIGSRFLIGNYQQTFSKSVGMLVFRHLVRRLTGLELTDTTSGYQCLNRKAMEYYIRHIFPCTYPDANVIIKAHRAGLRIKEIPVLMHPNPQGRSMHRGTRKVVRYMCTVLLDIYHSRKGR